MVVTDAAVAAAAPADAAGGAGRDRRSATSQIVVPAGEASKNLESLPVGRRPVAGGAGRAPHRGDRAGRRRGGRPGRVRRRDHAARPALRADPHHAAVAGRQFGRRQDRGEHARAARTWSARSTSRAWCWPTPRRWPPCPSRELRAGYAEIVKAGLIGDPAFFAWCEQHGAGVVGGDREAQAEAIKRACAFKAARGRRRRARGKAE